LKRLSVRAQNWLSKGALWPRETVPAIVTKDIPRELLLSKMRWTRQTVRSVTNKITPFAGVSRRLDALAKCCRGRRGDGVNLVCAGIAEKFPKGMVPKLQHARIGRPLASEQDVSNSFSRARRAFFVSAFHALASVQESRAQASRLRPFHPAPSPTLARATLRFLPLVALVRLAQSVSPPLPVRRFSRKTFGHWLGRVGLCRTKSSGISFELWLVAAGVLCARCSTYERTDLRGSPKAHVRCAPSRSHM